MKKILLILFLVSAFISDAQIKFSDLALYNGNMSGAYSVGYVGNANRRFDMNTFIRFQDSATYATYAATQKKIDSVVVVFNTALALRLLKNDTSSMLSPYLRSGIANATYATLSQNNLKLNISDTAGMLSTYARSANVNAQLALKQGSLTLTTTGSSGAASLIGNTLNIPQYSGGGGGTDWDSTKVKSYLTSALQNTSAYTTLTDASTVTWDFTNGNFAEVTLGGNRTLSVLNTNSLDVGVLYVTQDGTGSRGLTLPGNVATGKSLSTGAGDIDMLTFTNRAGTLYWDIINFTSTTPSETALVFDAVDGSVSLSAGDYTAGASQQRLAYNTPLTGNGYAQMNITSAADATILGFSSTSGVEGWTDATNCLWDVGAFVAGGDLYTVYNGVLATTQVNQGSIGSIVALRILRTGSTFYLHTSTDGTTFTSTYTFPGAYSGSKYAKAFISTSGNKVLQPKKNF